MFSRITKQKNKDGSTREYLCIVENNWVNGKVRQKTILNLGRVDKLTETELADTVAQAISKYTNKQKVINLLTDIVPASAKTYGEVLIFRKLWKELKLDRLLKKYFRDTEKEVDLTEAIFAMVCNRLIAPSSKRETNEWKADVYEPLWDKYDLHHFYRAMDFLVDNKEQIELDLFYEGKDMFNSKIDIVMFDTTNISYWGSGHEGTLMQYGGNAKNKRNDLKQLVVGIIMDRDGTPLGHEVWPGNMSDMTAFPEVVNKIKIKYQIGKVVLVCDRGMVSEKNIAFLETNGYEYILGVKLRKLSENRRKLLLNKDGFHPINDHLYGKAIKEHELYLREQLLENEIRISEGKPAKEIVSSEQEAYGVSERGKRTWAVCLNELVAKQDEANREFFRQILEKKVEEKTAKEWIVKNGYKKYIDIETLELKIDYQKLADDELYDGKWALLTNTDMIPGSLIMAYKDLARIERHFRDLKSELEMGPVRHRVDRRVRAHIFICFLALQLKHVLKYKLKALDEKLNYRDVIRNVSRLKAVEYKIQENIIIKRTNLEEKAYMAFKATACAVPQEILFCSNENLVATSA